MVEMAPRAFDRYMVCIGMGTHPKLASLSDGEFRAHVVGVLAVAAMAPVRGRLLIGNLPAEAVHIARAAGVPERVAVSTMRKLMAVGILVPDDEYNCLRVHDWEDVNPAPKGDRTGAERQRRYRERHATVTPTVTAEVTVVTPLVTPPEVEVEVEVASTSSQQVARKRVNRQVDQSVLPADFPADLLPRADSVQGVLTEIWGLRGGIEPQRRGVGMAMMRSPRADHVAVAYKLRHWLLAGNGQRARCADIAARFGDWIQDEGAAPRFVAPAGSELDRKRLESANRLMNGGNVA